MSSPAYREKRLIFWVILKWIITGRLSQRISFLHVNWHDRIKTYLARWFLPKWLFCKVCKRQSFWYIGKKTRKSKRKAQKNLIIHEQTRRVSSLPTILGGLLGGATVKESLQKGDSAFTTLLFYQRFAPLRGGTTAKSWEAPPFLTKHKLRNMCRFTDEVDENDKRHVRQQPNWWVHGGRPCSSARHLSPLAEISFWQQRVALIYHTVH